MAPNKRGGPPSTEALAILKGKKQPAALKAASGRAAEARDQDAAEPNDYASGVITKAEVEARGSGTDDHGDTYNSKQFWWSEYRVFFTGLMFLTRLPVPPGIDHHPAFLVRSMMWFPLFGALIGAWGAVWLNAAAVLWPPGIAAAVSTFATVWLTGCFHEDGLADTFDGFGGGWGRAQILRIMKDSRVGTYALVGTALALQLKTAALAALAGGPGGPAAASAALVAVHAVSRWSCIPLVVCCTYIQDDEDAKRGMYNWMAASTRLLTPPRIALGTLIALAAPAVALGAVRAAAVAATVGAVTVAAGVYGHAVIGGVVGDFLGATIAVCETLSYCVLAADWGRLGSMEGAWPLLVLAAVAALPMIYSRRVVDWGSC
ncbi:hypothetical protein GPECTOR_3g364 [Gonium pectorale]|uniref:Adenosylcobinamide-GDP ribazoletransferase n=1 Tax=Gonium pectorale TaxID=33097 RepID=A0A150GZS3_GONPE|nr:hypothetical protein GPECTOR_3g364 [Gonium pectorale]|eukprot:KXZ55222.1 hypothetical protein GPECTOR_3g364 [Gonium pectorale]